MRDVWPSLIDGGFLVYSTCTYNLEEDERNVERICRELGAEVVEIPVDDAWNITGNLLPGASFPVYHFFPHRTRGEGFFLALLRKKVSDVRPMHLKKQKPLVALKKDFRKLLDIDDSLVQWEKEDMVFAVPETWSSDFQSLCVVSHVLSAGIPLAQRKGNKYIPHHALAMSRHLNGAAFPSFEIDRNMALDYLRRLSLVLPAGVERGCVILQYQGFPLGFVNNLGSHANNLYPQNWKIRSGYIADIVNDFIVPL